MTAKTKTIIKQVSIILLFGGLAYCVYAIYCAFQNGVRTVTGLVSAPYTAIVDAINATEAEATEVASDVSAAAALPTLADQSAQLDTAITTQNNNDYAPGGRIYNNILATSGQAAADKAWADVQADDAKMTTQTSSWWNIFS